ncbi:hypothetical protein PHLGIDRAFT_70194 [Phlebiopsis gigantea 11061_1 CR5-6]|uniref:Cytochrome P450 n=1 Tax=Phlebiopsis gigantea (strain 11061_1 CR5-6) TaxID=745531 RepID=A0A0C3S951_PHLG1|nr:hypothetical protein PHLGIDRAFT_70194 [Phlebiopsis gigantea 11061_1 CR5-6]
MTSTLAYVLCAAAVGAVVLFSSKHRRRYPPGPRGLPLVGNLFDLPRESTWLTYEAWGRKYGSDILYLNVLGTHMIVLNSTEAAREILEKRASLYSDRSVDITQHCTGWSRNFGFIEYGDKWRAHRRMFHQQFTSSVLPRYHPTLKKEVHGLLRLLADSPDNFARHIRYMAGAATLRIVYDIEIQGEDDPRVATAEKAVHVITMIMTTGSYLGKTLRIYCYIPTWFPGAKFKRDAAVWKIWVDQMYYGFYRQLKAEIDDGQERNCVASNILARFSSEEYNEDLEGTIVNTVGTAYAGGVDTTVATLSIFVMAMLLYPEVQKKAQEELDRVLKRKRLPDFEDRNSLPYTVALVKEVLRWHPPLPTTVAHKSTADDVYKGFHIPAGSLVIGNAWAILRDEQRYSNAHIFDPSRFLTEDGQLDPNVPDPIETFGFGRRICPGRHFADDFSWLTVASVLAVFAIEPPRDAQNNVVEMREDFTSASLSVPKPYKANFRLRFTGATDLIPSPIVE